MSATNSVELDALYTKASNEFDLEGMVNCYDEDARFCPTPGIVLRGHAQIREAMRGYMAMKPKLELTVKQVVEAGDIALVICEWEFTGTDPSGKPITLRAEGREVHRRQPDGTWRILIDNPRYI